MVQVASGKAFDQYLREFYLKNGKAAADGEWAGVMPPSFACLKTFFMATSRGSNKGFYPEYAVRVLEKGHSLFPQTMNLNVDFADNIRRWLQEKSSPGSGMPEADATFVAKIMAAYKERNNQEVRPEDKIVRFPAGVPTEVIAEFLSDFTKLRDFQLRETGSTTIVRRTEENGSFPAERPTADNVLLGMDHPPPFVSVGA